MSLARLRELRNNVPRIVSNCRLDAGALGLCSLAVPYTSKLVPRLQTGYRRRVQATLGVVWLRKKATVCRVPLGHRADV